MHTQEKSECSGSPHTSLSPDESAAVQIHLEFNFIRKLRFSRYTAEKGKCTPAYITKMQRLLIEQTNISQGMALREPTWEGFTLNNKLRQYDVIGVGVNNLGSKITFLDRNVLKQQNASGGEWLIANRKLVFFLAESNVKWKQLDKWPLKATC